LIGMPRAIALSIAPSPFCVAGIFTNAFGRSTAWFSRMASASVSSSSNARFGSTSIETHPSRPPSSSASSQTGRRMSQARRTSDTASARKTSLASVSFSSTSRIWSS
jgi:hypothetical protein